MTGTEIVHWEFEVRRLHQGNAHRDCEGFPERFRDKHPDKSEEQATAYAAVECSPHFPHTVHLIEHALRRRATKVMMADMVTGALDYVRYVCADLYAKLAKHCGDPVE